MSSSYVCIQCGEAVQTLYMEYSENNFRLTRCKKCGQVADKYVEYELMLVLIDIIMHRRPAFCHLMYNRYSSTVTSRTAKVLPVAVIWSSSILKLIILNSFYEKAKLYEMMHALCATILELTVYLSIYGATLSFFWSSSEQSKEKSINNTRLFLAMLFPESFKAVAIVLYAFDSEPELVFLLCLLVLSIQYEAVQSVTDMSAKHLCCCFAFGLMARVSIKLLFYSTKQMWLMGGLT